MKKEKKILNDKEKRERKQKAIKYIKCFFHVLGYASLVAWGLLGLLYACGSNKQKQEANNVVEKQPNKAYNPNNSYTANIVTTPEDIAISDIYGAVYGSPQISPYRALMDFTYVKDATYIPTTANPVRYVCPNSISSYSFINTVFKDKDGNSKRAYTFSIEIRDKDGHLVVINGQRVDYIDINCSSDTACTWTLYSTNVLTNVQGNNNVLVMNTANSQYPYTYTQHNRTALFTEIFSGKYFYSKGVNYNATDYYAGSQYQRFIYAMSQFSIHSLKASIKDDINLQSFTPFIEAIGYENIYNNIVLTSYYEEGAGDLFVLYGDFYLNGVLYNRLTLAYNKVVMIPTSDYFIHIRKNGLDTGISEKIGDSSDYPDNWPNYYYLSGIRLDNTLDSSSILLGQPVQADAMLHYFNVYTGANCFDGSFEVRALVPTIKVNSGISGVSFDGVNSPFYCYTRTLDFIEYKNNFHFSVSNGEVTYYIIDTHNDNGITNYTGELNNVFYIINLAFSGLTGLMNYAILPGISIGVLIAIPLTLTIVLFVIKLFKR